MFKKINKVQSSLRNWYTNNWYKLSNYNNRVEQFREHVKLIFNWYEFLGETLLKRCFSYNRTSAIHMVFEIIKKRTSWKRYRISFQFYE